MLQHVSGDVNSEICNGIITSIYFITGDICKSTLHNDQIEVIHTHL